MYTIPKELTELAGSVYASDVDWFFICHPAFDYTSPYRILKQEGEVGYEKVKNLLVSEAKEMNSLGKRR